MRRSLYVVGSVLAAVLALAACATPVASGGDTAPGSDTPGAVAVAGAVDLDFTVPTLDGSSFDGHSLAGKPALLWFWAPWCPTCAKEAPEVGAAARDFDGEISFVGVAGLDTVAAMRDFPSLPKVDHFAHLADEQGVVWKRFGVTAQSTYVLLDASGKITYRGYLDGEELTRRLSSLAG